MVGDTALEETRMLSRSAFGLMAIAVLACSPSEKGGPGGGGAPGGGAPQAMPVKMMTLASSKVSDATEFIGTLKSRQSITVQSQVDGQITKIFVKPGDVVEAGTPILQIDPARQQASVSSAEASRASRQAALVLAQKQLEREQKLYDKGAAGREELDQAKAAVESAKADVAALGAQIRQNQVQLDYYKITAPAHGVIGDIPVRVGDRITPATTLTTLDDNSKLEAYVSLPVERASQVHDGTEVQLLDASGKPIAAGHVNFVSSQVNPETQSILIKTDVQPEKDVSLRAAQFVRARVVWSTHDGLVVPALSIVRLNGQTFVYVAEGEPGKQVAKMHPVALGDLQPEGYVVGSGLKAGDNLIVGNLQNIGDGAPVMPLPPEKPPEKG
jgi:RND family efflux transporter MFP subunit